MQKHGPLSLSAARTPCIEHREQQQDALSTVAPALASTPLKAATKLQPFSFHAVRVCIELARVLKPIHMQASIVYRTKNAASRNVSTRAIFLISAGAAVEAVRYGLPYSLPRLRAYAVCATCTRCLTAVRPTVDCCVCHSVVYLANNLQHLFSR